MGGDRYGREENSISDFVLGMINKEKKYGGRYEINTWRHAKGT